jgi:hypothetical protein
MSFVCCGTLGGIDGAKGVASEDDLLSPPLLLEDFLPSFCFCFGLSFPALFGFLFESFPFCCFLAWLFFDLSPVAGASFFFLLAAAVLDLDLPSVSFFPPDFSLVFPEGFFFPLKDEFCCFDESLALVIVADCAPPG